MLVKLLYKYVDGLFSFTRKNPVNSILKYLFCFTITKVVKMTNAGNFRKIKTSGILVLKGKHKPEKSEVKKFLFCFKLGYLFIITIAKQILKSAPIFFI